MKVKICYESSLKNIHTHIGILNCMQFRNHINGKIIKRRVSQYLFNKIRRNQRFTSKC